MTVVVTRDVAARYRGFLASVMPEVAPGVYVASELTAGVRTRMWTVVSEWWSELPGGSVVCVWREPGSPGGLGLVMVGIPVLELADLDGVLAVRYPTDEGDATRLSGQGRVSD